MVKHMNSLKANPWFADLETIVKGQLQALGKVLMNSENTPYVHDIENILKNLGMNPDFQKLKTDIMILNSDPNFIKIFIGGMIKSMMTMERE